MLGYQHSCISIGLVQDGRGVAGVVYNPYLEEMYVGIEDQGAFLNGQPIHAANRGMEDAIILFGTATYYQELADLTFAAAKAVFDRCADVLRSAFSPGIMRRHRWSPGKRAALSPACRAEKSAMTTRWVCSPAIPLYAGRFIKL